MPDPASGVLGGDGIEDWFGFRPQGFESACCFGLETLLHFVPEQL
jgi:hypothetical protein